MLIYKTETRPGLVALYDIRPANGAGQFLQPHSPHGALLRLGSNYVQSGTLPVHRNYSISHFKCCCFSNTTSMIIEAVLFHSHDRKTLLPTKLSEIYTN